MEDTKCKWDTDCSVRGALDLGVGRDSRAVPGYSGDVAFAQCALKCTSGRGQSPVVPSLQELGCRGASARLSTYRPLSAPIFHLHESY